MNIKYPIYFKPVYQHYIWGGRKIIDVYHRKEPKGIYAESWEISDRQEGMSVVANGVSRGRTLAEIMREQEMDLLGKKTRNGKFPLLIKLLDAQQALSVQVHPNDKSAAQYGGEAKTEMWYTLDAEPDAQVYCGLKRGVSRQNFLDALQNGSFKNILNSIPVQTGDAVFVPGGRVHAIGKGCLLLEVQQNSNTTYRIYDWDRLDAEGNPRELHTKQALEVIEWEDPNSLLKKPQYLGKEGSTEIWEVCRSPYFLMKRFNVPEDNFFENETGTFQVIFLAKGKAEITGGGQTLQMKAGMSCLLPACLEKYEIKAVKPCCLIQISE